MDAIDELHSKMKTGPVWPSIGEIKSKLNRAWPRGNSYLKGAGETTKSGEGFDRVSA